MLDMRMAKSPERVSEFLSDLAVKLQPLKTEEMALFLKYKKEDVSIHSHVFLYVANRIKNWCQKSEHHLADRDVAVKYGLYK